MDRKITPLIFSNSILYNQLKHVSLNTFLLRLWHVFPRASVVIVTHCAPHHHITRYQTPQTSTPSTYNPPSQHHRPSTSLMARFSFSKNIQQFFAELLLPLLLLRSFFFAFPQPFFLFLCLFLFFILLDFLSVRSCYVRLFAAKAKQCFMLWWEKRTLCVWVWELQYIRVFKSEMYVDVKRILFFTYPCKQFIMQGT